MLWRCMLRRWLEGAERKLVEDEEHIDPRQLCEERVAAERRYAEMRAYLGYPS